MAGNTATIDVQTLRLQWSSHSSMAAICTYWSITKDQLIRLRDVLPLPKRLDRSLRYKPSLSSYRDPTPREIAQACREIQAKWDDTTRAARAGHKEQLVRLRVVQLPAELAEEVTWETDSGEPS